VTTEEYAFWNYITKKLNTSVAFRAKDPAEQCYEVKQTARDHLEQVLRHICDGTMIYPYIEPDGEGGICATWRADTYALVISVDDDLSTHVIFQHPGHPLEQCVLDLSDNALTQRIREHLYTLSTNVKRANPNWQSVFAK
jgi:hypothetical protein